MGIRVEKHTSNVQTFNRSMHPRVQSVLASRHCGSSRAKVRLHEKGKAVYFSKHPSIRGLDTGPEEVIMRKDRDKKYKLQFQFLNGSKRDQRLSSKKPMMDIVSNCFRGRSALSASSGRLIGYRLTAEKSDESELDLTIG
uniref:Uncharacterized protein n=1 Tax=Vespula pensylvanica TaxID=30213 RepID=A0A834UEA7_VESPE|nr:hypothetical protein H0235_002416 [Vespula pensylvanica]